jgi:hypothetical protein
MSTTHTDSIHRRARRAGVAFLAALFCVCAALVPARAVGAPQQQSQKSYPSPEEAVAALVAAVKANDRLAFDAVVGNALDQLASGDDVQDNLALMTFAKRLLEKVDIVKTNATTAVLYTGPENTLFRLPIVKGSRGWYFDVEAGKKEMLDQRIGQNERRALEICRLYTKAQTQYAAEDRDGDGVLEFAQQFFSSPGKQDGLFWPNSDMSKESPFGPLMSLAKAQGYVRRGERAQPFQGYYYRILVRQGPNAPGGIKDFVLSNGNMTGGFGIVAYPARWGVSGIKTYVVGPDGRVLEKNLGQATGMYASAMREYNPDGTWVEVMQE